MTLPILILPAWRYHATQGGKIFRTGEEIAEAEAEGWRDSPAAAAAAKADERVALTPAEVAEITERADEQVAKALAKKRKR